MRKAALLALLLLLAVPAMALAQTAPGLVTGQVPTAVQWNGYFAAKQDYNPVIPTCAWVPCQGAATIFPNSLLMTNSSNALSFQAVTGDGTINGATGHLTVTGANGQMFAPSATTDTTNASNITSGTLLPGRLGGLSTVTPNTGNIVIYMATAGSATGTACFTFATPCSFASAMSLAGSLVNASGKIVAIEAEDNGPYTGGEIAGQPSGTLHYSTSEGDQFPLVLIEPYSGSGPVIINQPAGQAQVLFVDRTHLDLINVELSVTAANGIGLFLQNHSYATGSGITVTSAIAAVTGDIAVHTEGYSYFEPASFAVNGAWQFVLDGDEIGYFEIDPGTTFTCQGSFSDSAALIRLRSSVLNTIGTTWSGCPSTGIGLLAAGPSGWERTFSTDYVPGATYQIDGINDVYGYQQFQSSVTACTNGAIASGSSNYSGNITFSGSASSCTLTFGKPTAITSYFTSPPACTASGSVATTSTPASVTSFTISGSFVNGTSLQYNCLPFNGG